MKLDSKTFRIPISDLLQAPDCMHAIRIDDAQTRIMLEDFGLVGATTTGLSYATTKLVKLCRSGGVKTVQDYLHTRHIACILNTSTQRNTSNAK